MWIPRNVGDLERAIAERLGETSQLDYKRELPSATKNVELAVDVAAMANEGGALVFGVAEDDDRRPVQLHPITGMQAACERIDQIVAQSLSGPPLIRFEQIPISVGADEGYLVVQVPASPWAPHMVLRRHRYYGRSETANRPLEDHEVGQLLPDGPAGNSTAISCSTPPSRACRRHTSGPRVSVSSFAAPYSPTPGCSIGDGPPPVGWLGPSRRSFPPPSWPRGVRSTASAGGMT